MPQQIVSVNDIKRDRRALAKRTVTRDYILHGREHKLDIEFVQGELQNRPLFATGQHHILRKYLGAVNYGGGQPVAGELLTTPANLQAFIQKTIIDLQIGLEDVPLLYEPIYRRISDANLTEQVDVRAIVSRANVVFFSHIEGEEVKFGSRLLGPLQTVPLITWAAAFEWTEDLVEYDKTWEVQQINEGFGRAYNGLLNHIHFGPILNPLGPDGLPIPYPAKNYTAAATSADTGTTEYRVNLRRTIQNGMQAAEADRQTDTGMGRYPTILLAHPSRRFDFEDAPGPVHAQRHRVPEPERTRHADLLRGLQRAGWGQDVHLRRRRPQPRSS